MTKKISIVVDVLRASSTITALLGKGCSKVFPVSTIDEAYFFKKKKGYLIAGERNGITLPDFDFGNSPIDLEQINVKGKNVILTTTNGTKVIRKLMDSEKVFIGCLLNAGACITKVLSLFYKQSLNDIYIVCAGNKGKFALDDAICAGYLVETICRLTAPQQDSLIITDAAVAVRQIYRSYPDILSGFKESTSGQILIDLSCYDDIHYCAEIDVYNCVPVLNKNDVEPYFQNY